jgi:hypothetical protein
MMRPVACSDFIITRERTVSGEEALERFDVSTDHPVIADLSEILARRPDSNCLVIHVESQDNRLCTVRLDLERSEDGERESKQVRIGDVARTMCIASYVRFEVRGDDTPRLAVNVAATGRAHVVVRVMAFGTNPLDVKTVQQDAESV